MSTHASKVGPGLPSVGKVARVRTRQYLIEEVVPPPNRGDQTLVPMSCLGDVAFARSLRSQFDGLVDSGQLRHAAGADSHPHSGTR
jgi:hypothetical protein